MRKDNSRQMERERESRPAKVGLALALARQRMSAIKAIALTAKKAAVDASPAVPFSHDWPT